MILNLHNARNAYFVPIPVLGVELAELAQGDLVEPPAVDGVALPEHSLDELVLPSPFVRHSKHPLEHLLGLLENTKINCFPESAPARYSSTFLSVPASASGDSYPVRSTCTFLLIPIGHEAKSNRNALGAPAPCPPPSSPVQPIVIVLTYVSVLGQN